MSQPHEPAPDGTENSGTESSGTETGDAGRSDQKIRSGQDIRPNQPAGETEPLPRVAGAQPPTESEPAPSAAFAAEPPPGSTGVPPQAAQPAGHYVFVPFGSTVRPPRRYGPAFGRFARNRGTQLVAAVVVGAVIGAGTVAIVDNAASHTQYSRPAFRPGQFGGQFGAGGRQGLRFGGSGTNPGAAQGGQGTGN